MQLVIGSVVKVKSTATGRMLKPRYVVTGFHSTYPSVHVVPEARLNAKPQDVAVDMLEVQCDDI